jgi:hypothetical protein
MSPCSANPTPLQEAKVTSKVFFDVEIDGKPAGRIVMGLYGKVRRVPACTRQSPAATQACRMGRPRATDSRGAGAGAGATDYYRLGTILQRRVMPQPTGGQRRSGDESGLALL